MNDIIGGLKAKNEFPEWYEGLHKALFRANEFLGKIDSLGSPKEFEDTVI